MWPKRKVGLKYCGNCNPGINGFQIVADLQLYLRDTCVFVPWHEADLDLLLIVSGCAVDCATRPNCQVPTIVVAASCIDHVLVCGEDFMITLRETISDALSRQSHTFAQTSSPRVPTAHG